MKTSTNKAPRVTIAAVLFAVAAVSLVTTAVVSTQRPRFYPDDPIGREPESQDASKAQPNEIEQMYEMVYNLFVEPGRKPPNVRAGTITTSTEVPGPSRL